jgi:hypothetical protein
VLTLPARPLPGADRLNHGRSADLPDSEIIALCAQQTSWARVLKILSRTRQEALHVELAIQYEQRTLKKGFIEPYLTDEPRLLRSEEAPALLADADLVEGQQVFAIAGTLAEEICPRCQWIRKSRCGSCYGSGKINCSSCGGRGTQANPVQGGSSDCGRCKGGKVPCYSCKGESYRACGGCEDQKKVRRYDRITVDFTTDRVERSSLPADFPSFALGDARGPRRSVDEKQLSAESDAVRKAGASLLGLVMPLAGRQLVFRRLTVMTIPLWRVEYSLLGSRRVLWVRGDNRLLFAPSLQDQGRALWLVLLAVILSLGVALAVVLR